MSTDDSGTRSSQERFGSDILAKIIDASSISSFVIDRNHRVTHWNTAMQALTGIRREDILGTDGQWRAFYSKKRPVMADLIADGASDREITSLYSEKCRRSPLINGAYEAEDFFPDLGQTGKWLRFTASPIKDDGVTIGVIETLEDVTERKLAEENLDYYLKAITSAQENERKRIARDLHDDTLQMLASVSRQIDIFIHENRDLDPGHSVFLRDIHDQLAAGAKNVHRFSQALRLSVLDDFGLIPALRSLLKGLQDRDAGKSELRVIGDERRLGSAVETALFRIVQEAVNNIGKHALPCDTLAVLEFAKDTVKLTVEDTGKGFVLVESVEALPRLGKLGLAGIHERARLLGGTFDVVSSPGKGTVLTVVVPATSSGGEDSASLDE